MGLTTAELSNIRGTPDDASAILMRVKAQTPLRITGKEGPWMQLLLRDGGTGWIHQSLVEKVVSPEVERRGQFLYTSPISFHQTAATRIRIPSRIGVASRPALVRSKALNCLNE